MSEQTFSRSYHSELRAEQAQRTRERIMQAAAHEFGTSGYQATTMAAIARSAGVSTETVKAAGSKAELLIRSFETVFALQEGADSLADSPAAAGLLDAREATVLNAVIDVIAWRTLAAGACGRNSSRRPCPIGWSTKRCNASWRAVGATIGCWSTNSTLAASSARTSTPSWRPPSCRS